MKRLAALWGVAAVLLGVLAGGCSDPADALNSEDADQRIKAIRELAKRDNDEAVDCIAEVTAHKDLATATEAVTALGRSRRRKATRALRQVVTKERRPRVREVAVIALGRRKQEESAAALRQVVRTDPEPRVRARAAAALGTAGTLDDVDLLVEVAVNTGELSVESAAVGAIERLLTLRFKYRSSAPEAERRAAVERIRILAPGFARNLKRIRAQKEAAAKNRS